MQDRVPIRNSVDTPEATVSDCIIVVHHEDLMIGPSAEKRKETAFYAMQLSCDTICNGSELKLCAFKSEERKTFDKNLTRVSDADAAMWTYLDQSGDEAITCRDVTSAEGLQTAESTTASIDAESQATCLRTLGCKTIILEIFLGVAFVSTFIAEIGIPVARAIDIEDMHS